MSIAAKLVAAMGEIDAVTKEGKNELQKYKYVRAADVANEVRKVLVKNGIAFTYSVDKHEHWTVDRIDRQTGTVIGQMNYSTLWVDFGFIDAELGEKITLKGIGCGQDTGEKAIYKAMTGALKYALRMNFIIPDESDPENEKAEVFAEVERQKANPAKDNVVDLPQTGPRLTAALEGSVRLEAEKRAAAERTKLAEQQGIFSLDGNILHCKIIGIQKKTNAKGDFYSVTFNGRLNKGKVSFLGDGNNYASCFDKDLWPAVDAALDKECKLKVVFKEVKGVTYANITDVVWVQGVGHIPEPAKEITDADIPF